VKEFTTKLTTLIL